MYDSRVDAIYLSSTISAEEKQTRFQGPVSFLLFLKFLNISFPSVEKKTRESFQTWTPAAQDEAALEGAIPIPCQGLSLLFTACLIVIQLVSKVEGVY